MGSLKVNIDGQWQSLGEGTILKQSKKIGKFLHRNAKKKKQAEDPLVEEIMKNIEKRIKGQ